MNKFLRYLIKDYFCQLMYQPFFYLSLNEILSNLSLAYKKLLKKTQTTYLFSQSFAKSFKHKIIFKLTRNTNPYQYQICNDYKHIPCNMQLYFNQ